MARKRTKKEAIDRLEEAYGITSRLPKGRGRLTPIHELAYAGAAGLIMLDPFNRLADERIVLPLDMVCIPAYQAYMIQGSPSMQIYVRAGETIIPTGGNVQDVQEALEAVPEPSLERLRDTAIRKSTNPTAYQKRYKKAFKQVSSKHKKKDGTWKKGGFKKAVKEAHAKAKK